MVTALRLVAFLLAAMATAVRGETADILLCKAVDVMTSIHPIGVNELAFDVIKIVEARIIADYLKQPDSNSSRMVTTWKHPTEACSIYDVNTLPSLRDILDGYKSARSKELPNLDVILDLITAALHYSGRPEDTATIAMHDFEKLSLEQQRIVQGPQSKNPGEFELEYPLPAVDYSHPVPRKYDEASKLYEEIAIYLNTPWPNTCTGDANQNITSRSSWVTSSMGREALVRMDNQADEFTLPLNRRLLSPDLNYVLLRRNEVYWLQKIRFLDATVSQDEVPGRFKLFGILHVVMKALKSTIKEFKRFLGETTGPSIYFKIVTEQIRKMEENRRIMKWVLVIRECIFSQSSRGLYLEFQHVKLVALRLLIQFGLLIEFLKALGISDNILSNHVKNLKTESTSHETTVFFKKHYCRDEWG